MDTEDLLTPHFTDLILRSDGDPDNRAQVLTHLARGARLCAGPVELKLEIDPPSRLVYICLTLGRRELMAEARVVSDGEQ